MSDWIDALNKKEAETWGGEYVAPTPEPEKPPQSTYEPPDLTTIQALSPGEDVGKRMGLAQFYNRFIGLPLGTAYEWARETGEKIWEAKDSVGQWAGEAGRKASDWIGTSAAKVGELFTALGDVREMGKLGYLRKQQGGELFPAQQERYDELLKATKPEDIIGKAPAVVLQGLTDMGFTGIKASEVVYNTVGAFLTMEFATRAMGFESISQGVPQNADAFEKMMGVLQGGFYQGQRDAGVDHTTAAAMTNAMTVIDVALTASGLKLLPGVRQLTGEALTKAAAKSIFNGKSISTARIAWEMVKQGAGTGALVGGIRGIVSEMAHFFAAELTELANKGQVDKHTVEQILQSIEWSTAMGATAGALLSAPGAFKEGGKIHTLATQMAEDARFQTAKTVTTPPAASPKAGLPVVQPKAPPVAPPAVKPFTAPTVAAPLTSTVALPPGWTNAADLAKGMKGEAANAYFDHMATLAGQGNVQRAFDEKGAAFYAHVGEPLAEGMTMQPPADAEMPATATPLERVPTEEELELTAPLPPAQEPPETFTGPAMEQPPGKIPFRAESVPVEKILDDPEIPNFKSEPTPLVGPLEHAGLAPIILLEKKDGTLVVITGRNRLARFRKDGVPTIQAHIFREEDGFTVDDGRIMDLDANSKDGQGSTKDYARAFRDLGVTLEQATERGWLERSKTKAAFDIGAYASDGLYSAFQAGLINEARTVAIARGAPRDAEVQAIAQKETAVPTEQLEGYAKDLVADKQQRRAQPGAEEQPELWATPKDYQKELVKERQAAQRLIDGNKQELADLNAARRLAGKDRKARLKQYGTVDLDDEAIDARITAINDEQAAMKEWKTNRELHNKVRAEAGLPPMEYTIAPETVPTVTEQPANLFDEPPAIPGMDSIVSRKDLNRAAGKFEDLMLKSPAAEQPKPPVKRKSVYDFFRDDPELEPPIRGAVNKLISKIEAGSSEPATEARDIADETYDVEGGVFPIEKIHDLREMGKKPTNMLNSDDLKTVAEAVGYQRFVAKTKNTMTLYPTPEGTVYPTDVAMQMLKDALEGKAKPSGRDKPPVDETRMNPIKDMAADLKGLGRTGLGWNRKYLFGLADIDVDRENGIFFKSTGKWTQMLDESEVIRIREQMEATINKFFEATPGARRWVEQKIKVELQSEGRRYLQPFTHDETLAIYLHSLNKRNEASLLTGIELPNTREPDRLYLLSGSEYGRIVDLMAADPIARGAATALQKMLEDIWPRVSEAGLRIHGWKVGHEPNYWLLHHTSDAKGIDSKEAFDKQMADEYGRFSGTETTHVQKRHPSSGPLILRGAFADAFGYIEWAANFVGKGERVAAAGRILFNPTIAKIIAAKHGQNAVENLQAGLREVSGMHRSSTQVEVAAEWIRTHAVALRLFLWAPSVAKGMTDSWRTWGYVDIRAFVKGQLRALVNYRKVHRDLMVRSAKFRDALQSGALRELQDIKAAEKGSGIVKKVSRLATKVGLAGLRWVSSGQIAVDMTIAEEEFYLEADAGKLSEAAKTATGLQDSDLPGLSSDERVAAATLFGEWLWEHTTQSPSKALQTPLYFQGFLGRSATSLMGDRTAWLNEAMNTGKEMRKWQSRAKEDPTSENKKQARLHTWAFTKVLATGLLILPYAMWQIDEQRRKALGQKSRKFLDYIWTDWLGNFYFAGDVAQTIQQKTKYGVAATTGSQTLVGGLADDVTDMLAYGFTAMDPKKSEATRLKNWWLFAESAVTLGPGIFTGVNIKNILSQGNAAMERLTGKTLEGSPLGYQRNP